MNTDILKCKFYLSFIVLEINDFMHEAKIITLIINKDTSTNIWAIENASNQK